MVNAPDSYRRFFFERGDELAKAGKKLMCLILDVNIIPQVFPVPSGDFEPVFEAVTSGHVKLVYGGKLTREYERIGWFRKLLVILDRQGECGTGILLNGGRRDRDGD